MLTSTAPDASCARWGAGLARMTGRAGAADSFAPSSTSTYGGLADWTEWMKLLVNLGVPPSITASPSVSPATMA